ncbi:cucurbitadienol 11-hydroxylase-like [Arachis duranensis]|uniref:Cucurbitadienol 11-hydroxylase-like n=1 Tax=Arachis duranensis TaxID=130453 RepID=A0A9C6WU35_ARADU|nr:cucurbitadienol 11-hydroxylase-like [Arachis duranensis]
MWILMGLCIVAVLVIYVFHWIIILKDPKFRNRSSLPPGSLGIPFIGETLQFMIPSYSLDIHPFITKRIQRFGSIFRTSLFGQPIVISTDSEFNSYLMQQEGKLVEIWAGPVTKIFQQSDGSGIPFSNIHKYIRSITLNHIGAECIKEKLISQFEEMFIKTLDQWSTQTSIDVKQSITKDSRSSSMADNGIQQPTQAEILAQIAELQAEIRRIAELSAHNNAGKHEEGNSKSSAQGNTDPLNIIPPKEKLTLDNPFSEEITNFQMPKNFVLSHTRSLVISALMLRNSNL